MLNLQYVTVSGRMDEKQGLSIDATNIVAQIHDSQDAEDRGAAMLRDFGDEIAKKIVNLAQAALDALPAEMARPSGDWTARITMDEGNAIMMEYTVQRKLSTTRGAAALTRALGGDRASEILTGIAKALTENIGEPVEVLVTHPNVESSDSGRIGAASRHVFADPK